MGDQERYNLLITSNTMKAEKSSEAAKGPDQDNKEIEESYQELYSKNKANKPLKPIEVSLSLI